MFRNSRYFFKCLNNQFIPSFDIACTSPVVYAQPCAQPYNPGRCQLTECCSPYIALNFLSYYYFSSIETFTRTFFSFGNSFIPLCKSSFLFFLSLFSFLKFYFIIFSLPTHPPLSLHPPPSLQPWFLWRADAPNSFLIGCIVYRVSSLVTKSPAISVISSSNVVIDFKNILSRK